MPSNPLNPRVGFVLEDKLRLEVEAAQPLSGLVNLVQNPIPTLGCWWWTTPSSNTRCTNMAGLRFRVQRMNSAGPCTFASGYMPVSYGYTTARFDLSNITAGRNVKAWFEFSRRDRTVISTASTTAALTTAGTHYVATSAVPADAKFVRLILGLFNGSGDPSATDRFDVTKVMVVPDDPSTTSGLLPSSSTFPGEDTLPSGAAEFDYADPGPWINVLDSGTSLTITREAFNLGVLNAALTDPALDPSDSDVLAHGRRIRVMALCSPPGGGVAKWRPIFTGRIADTTADYVLKRDGSTKTLISVIAHDAMAELANIDQAIGVSSTLSLVALMEGLPIPYEVIGEDGITSLPATRVSYNPQASRADQVAIFRDVKQTTNPGLFAIVTREGVLLLDDDDSYAGLSYDLDYSAVKVGYDTVSLINSVQVKWLRDWADVGDAQQANYGPFVYQNSIDRYGPCTATYTLHGPVESYPDIKAYAAAVISSNHEPRRQITAMSVAVLDDDDITRAVYSDLCNRVEVVTDLLASDVRVNSIAHRITPNGWLVDYTFTNPDARAAPTEVPSSSGAATDGEAVDIAPPPPEGLFPSSTTYPSLTLYPGAA